MPIYASDFEVEFKKDESPLTNADKASHEYIVSKLEALTPDTPILSEESTSIHWEERREWAEYWLIDPLDGTKEFIKKNGEFTVNIALIKEGVPVVGVVYAPELEITWYAASGAGVYKKHRGQEALPIRASSPQDYASLKIVVSRSHQSNAIKAFCGRFDCPELVPMGSSLKICAVADSEADIYPRLGLTSEWDTAAAHCIVLEAGGALVDADGVPLVYNSKESLLNPFFLVLGNADEYWRATVVNWFSASCTA